jgi:hypothetical protein
LLMIMVLGVKNAPSLIGASTFVSMLLTLILPLLFVAGVLYARKLRTSKPQVYARLGRQ